MTRWKMIRRKGFGPGASLLLAIFLAGGVISLAALKSQAQEAVKKIPEATKKNKFIGVGKCKNCHDVEAHGNQYKIWTEAKHALAFETLGTPAAKKLGQERGVEDPQKSPECLKCHVTGYGQEKAVSKAIKEKYGVQCESCHGPGQQHFKARFAAAAEAPEGEAAEYQKIPSDEIVSRPDVEVCLTCHNDESPSFKGFCFKERVSKILHRDPRKKRTEEEGALACGCGEDCKCQKGECGGWPAPSK